MRNCCLVFLLLQRFAVLIFVCFVLARGRVNVARLLLDMLPPELAAISTPEERVAEYLDYRQFFIAWETLERVTEYQALEAPQTSRNMHTAWLEDYGVRALHFPSPLVFLK